MRDLRAEIAAVFNDPWQFARCLWIKDKSGKLVQFDMNQSQRILLKKLLEGKNVVVLKHRQGGITTLCCAYMFWRALVSSDPISCVSLLHKKDAADEVFLKYKEYYYGIPELIRTPLDKETSSTFRFKTGSSVMAITAAGHAGLRSYTINAAHVSELCFYDDPDEILSNVLSALNGNQLIVESTATAYGDPMHQLVDSIQRGERPGNWELVFFPWYQHEDYREPAPEGWLPDSGELAIQKALGVDLDQLYWRHCKIAEIGIDKFNTEYPGTIEDVFSQKGDCYYTDEDLQYVTKLAPISYEKTLEEPKAGINYAIGVDVASGIAKDYSSIFVLSQKTSSPVYVFRSNTIAPTALAKKIQAVSARYNKAKTLVESNNWGHTVINELEHLGFNSFWKKDGKHWETTAQSKTLMHEQLKEAIRKGSIHSLDEITITELKGLIVTNQSKAPESQRTKQGHGDNVIALGLAWQCLQSLPKPSYPIDPIRALMTPTKQDPYERTWRH